MVGDSTKTSEHGGQNRFLLASTQANGTMTSFVRSIRPRGRCELLAN